MLEVAKLSIKDRTPYLEEVASRRGLTKLIVEKDFWSCFILQRIFNIPDIKNEIIFKGGTSLSKVFGIINRFSEDIDLTLKPAFLGFSKENLPEISQSISQRKKCHDELISKCKLEVENKLQPIFEKDITILLGPPASGSNYIQYNYDERSKSPNLVFSYPTDETDEATYIQPLIRLEFGSHTGFMPNGVYPITSWLSEEYPKIFKKSEISVVSLSAERTFWEKATILHAEHHKQRDKPMRPRLSRDYYDLFCMAKHKLGEKAISDFKLLEEVVKYKQEYFHAAWAKYDEAKPGTLRLVPPDNRLSELEKDYEKMQEMIYGSPPKFKDLVSTIKQIEKQINNK